MRDGLVPGIASCLPVGAQGAEALTATLAQFVAEKRTGQVVLHLKEGVVNKAEFWGVVHLKLAIVPLATPHAVNGTGRR